MLDPYWVHVSLVLPKKVTFPTFWRQRVLDQSSPLQVTPCAFVAMWISKVSIQQTIILTFKYSILVLDSSVVRYWDTPNAQVKIKNAASLTASLTQQLDILEEFWGRVAYIIWSECTTGDFAGTVRQCLYKCSRPATFHEKQEVHLQILEAVKIRLLYSLIIYHHFTINHHWSLVSTTGMIVT